MADLGFEFSAEERDIYEKRISAFWQRARKFDKTRKAASLISEILPIVLVGLCIATLYVSCDMIAKIPPPLRLANISDYLTFRDGAVAVGLILMILTVAVFVIYRYTRKISRKSFLDGEIKKSIESLEEYECGRFAEAMRIALARKNRERARFPIIDYHNHIQDIDNWTRILILMCCDAYYPLAREIPYRISKYNNHDSMSAKAEIEEIIDFYRKDDRRVVES